jgi:hypothetical protein
MKIIKTDIFDINESNIDEQKLSVANNILELVGPMFESEIQDSKKKLKEVHNKKVEMDEQLQKVKGNLENIQVEFNRETKRKKLLNRIRQLIDVNLTSDPSLKSEVIILLKVIDKLDDSLLDEHIENMIKKISKRFSKQI